MSLGDKGQIQFERAGDSRGKEGITLCRAAFLALVRGRCAGRRTSFLNLRPFSTEGKVGKVEKKGAVRC